MGHREPEKIQRESNHIEGEGTEGENDKEKHAPFASFSVLPVAQLWPRIFPASPQISQHKPA